MLFLLLKTKSWLILFLWLIAIEISDTKISFWKNCRDKWFQGHVSVCNQKPHSLSLLKVLFWVVLSAISLKDGKLSHTKNLSLPSPARSVWDWVLFIVIYLCPIWMYWPTYPRVPRRVARYVNHSHSSHKTSTSVDLWLHHPDIDTCTLRLC